MSVRAVLLLTALACCRGKEQDKPAFETATPVAAAAATIDAGCDDHPPTQTAQAPRAAPAAPAADESAGMSCETYTSMMPYEHYIEETGVDVVIVTVEEILSTHAATNANPPLVRVRVDEVLRGDPAADRTRTRWTTTGPGDNRDNNDTGDEAYGKELEAQYQARLAAWSPLAICPPAIGDAFVLIGRVGRTGFDQIPQHRLRATPENIARARKGATMAAERRRQWEVERERKRLEKEAALAAWRARAKLAELRRLARTADLVAIGRPSSGAWERFQFEVKRTLSGKLRGLRWVDYLEVDDGVSLLLSAQDRDVLLFLDDTGDDRNGAPVYEKVGYGVFPADPDLIELVEKAVAGK